MKKKQSKEYKFKFAENHLDGYNQGHEKWTSPYKEVDKQKLETAKKNLKEKSPESKIKKYKS
jgi:hypothetical protein